MPRRMGSRVGGGRISWTALGLVVLNLACLTGVTNTFKVAEVERSLNATRYQAERDDVNEVLQQLEVPTRLDEYEVQTPMDQGDKRDQEDQEDQGDQRDQEGQRDQEDQGGRRDQEGQRDQGDQGDHAKGIQDHPHLMPGKPSKFDVDIGGMMHTDKKNLHQAEAERLANMTKPNFVSTMDRMDEPDECDGGISMACLKECLGELLDDMASVDAINVTESVQIVRTQNSTRNSGHNDVEDDVAKRIDILEKVHRFAKSHVLRIKVPKELATSRQSRTFFGAFGLKKLLFPLFLGAQLVKSVLIALFLPSIIGSIGKIVGKGVSSFAQSSQGATAQPEENFEFKDNSDLYNEDYMTRQPLGTLPASAMYDEGMLAQAQKQEIASRYSFVDPRITNANSYSDRYYTRHVATNGLSKKQDFKVFHDIPTSSLLLTNYDPFYSPLLSRLDAVFSRLGHSTEGCREFAVCAMYKSPARYAPYSNLVSAQLSRELNELRRPSNDNPDVLRFFRYMKAAKDGQDGVKCEEIYSSCSVARDDPNQRQNQAMLATYQDIDKLVHARKL